MKTYLLWVLALVGALALVCLSCRATPDQYAPLVASIDQARAPTSPGGVRITEDEGDAIEAAVPGQSGFDWSLVLQVAVAIGGALVGVKVMPSSALEGPFDRPKPTTRTR